MPAPANNNRPSIPNPLPNPPPVNAANQLLQNTALAQFGYHLHQQELALSHLTHQHAQLVGAYHIQQQQLYQLQHLMNIQTHLNLSLLQYLQHRHQN